MDQVTIGFIGVGDIMHAHLAALKENPEYKLVAICRRTEDKLRQQAEELGCEGYTDYHDLLAAGPDVVLVSLPHGLHAQVTIEALEAGCHVMVEKPMATSVAECNEMLATAERTGKALIVTELASFTPGAVRTGEKFKAGTLGRFFTGSIINERFYFHEGRPTWFLDPEMSGGGMFTNVGVHRLATTRSALPGLRPISVSASVSYQPEWKVEACTSALVKYEQGGSMLYEEVGYYPKPDWLNQGIHYVFENGIVSWSNDTWYMMGRDGEQYEEPLEPNPRYAPIYENMLKAIRGEEYWPKAWELAVDTAIAQATLASARDGQQIDLTSPEWAIQIPK